MSISSYQKKNEQNKIWITGGLIALVITLCFALGIHAPMDIKNNQTKTIQLTHQERFNKDLMGYVVNILIIFETGAVLMATARFIYFQYKIKELNSKRS